MFGVQVAQLVLVSVLLAFLVVAGARTAARSAWVRTLSRRDLVLLGLCLLVALVARLAVRPFLSNMQPDAAQGLVFGGAHRWGAAYTALLHFVYLFLPAGVATAAKLNVVVSVATVFALFVLVDVYFRDRLAAFAAAAVLALQPISVRYAASDSSSVVVAFCAVAGPLFLAAWARSGDRRQLWQGVGWVVFAANVRYEAVIYAVAGAAAALGAGGWPDRRRLRQLLGGIALGSLFLLYPAGRALFDASQGVFEVAPMGWIGAFLLSPYSPVPFVALAAVGLASAAFERFRETVWFLAALYVVSFPGMYIPFECSDLSNRYALGNLAFWAVFAGWGFRVVHRWLLAAARRWRRGGGGLHPAPQTPADLAAGATRLPWIASLVALALAAAAALPHRDFLGKSWTYALEYEFVQEHLPDIPDDCLLIGPASDWEIRGLRITPLLSRLAGRQHRWLWVDSPEVLEGRVPECTVYYQATACYAFEGALRPNRPAWVGRQRDVCERMTALYDLEPIATTTLPSIGYACEQHSVVPVPAGFYRARPRRAPTTAPTGAEQDGPG